MYRTILLVNTKQNKGLTQCNYNNIRRILSKHALLKSIEPLVRFEICQAKHTICKKKDNTSSQQAVSTNTKRLGKKESLFNLSTEHYRN